MFQRIYWIRNRLIGYTIAQITQKVNRYSPKKRIFNEKRLKAPAKRLHTADLTSRAPLPQADIIWYNYFDNQNN
jgi:hypothetical protein